MPLMTVSSIYTCHSMRKLKGMPLLSGVNPKADHPLGLGSPHLPILDTCYDLMYIHDVLTIYNFSITLFCFSPINNPGRVHKKFRPVDSVAGLFCMKEQCKSKYWPLGIGQRNTILSSRICQSLPGPCRMRGLR